MADSVKKLGTALKLHARVGNVAKIKYVMSAMYAISDKQSNSPSQKKAIDEKLSNARRAAIVAAFEGDSIAAVNALDGLEYIELRDDLLERIWVAVARNNSFEMLEMLQNAEHVPFIEPMVRYGRHTMVKYAARNGMTQGHGAALKVAALLGDAAVVSMLLHDEGMFNEEWAQFGFERRVWNKRPDIEVAARIAQELQRADTDDEGMFGSLDDGLEVDIYFETSEYLQHWLSEH